MANTSVEVKILDLLEFKEFSEEFSRLKARVAEYEKKEAEAALGSATNMRILEGGRVALNGRIVPHFELEYYPAKLEEDAPGKPDSGSFTPAYYSILLDNRMGYD